MVYYSRFGHNKQIVEYIKEKLSNKGHTVNVIESTQSDPKNLPNADVFVFSASVEAFRIKKEMRHFMKKMDGVNGKKCALINTHGMKKRNWLKSMEKMITKKNMQKMAEIDFIIGEGQDKGEGLEKDWKKKLDGFIESIQNS